MLESLLAWWERISAVPWIAHILRAVERFNLRGGSLFAAAIAYFSVLSLVPVLMLSFSALGLTITVLRPDALGEIEQWIIQTIGTETDLSTQLTAVVRSTLGNWAAILGVGLLVAIWTGAGWMGNLKRAVRAIMRADADEPGPQLMLPLDILVNFAGLVGLLLGVAATFAASGAAGVLANQLGDLLGTSQSTGWTILVRVLSAVLALIAGTLLFWWLFSWFAPVPVPRNHILLGSATGSTSLLVLQSATGYLISAFSRNLSASVFGSVIVLMLFLNLFATLILFVAAWLATVNPPAPEPVKLEQPEPQAVVENRPGEKWVSAAVARKSLGAGLSAGWLAGSATGLGVGAMIAAAIAAIRRKK